MEDGMNCSVPWSGSMGTLAFPAFLCYSIDVDTGGVLAAVFIHAARRPDLFCAPVSEQDPLTEIYMKNVKRTGGMPMKSV